MSRWTDKDLEEYQKRHQIKNLPPILASNLKQRIKVPKIESPEKKEFMAAVVLFCRSKKLPLFAEQRFDIVRGWRFDLLIPGIPVVALEYEGLFSEKSGHTTIKGFVDNCDKYNAAAISGILVIRYTAKNWQKVLSDLEKIYNDKNKNRSINYSKESDCWPGSFSRIRSASRHL